MTLEGNQLSLSAFPSVNTLVFILPPSIVDVHMCTCTILPTVLETSKHTDSLTENGVVDCRVARHG